VSSFASKEKLARDVWRPSQNSDFQRKANNESHLVVGSFDHCAKKKFGSERRLEIKSNCPAKAEGLASE
jgi:hypothetical protein